MLPRIWSLRWWPSHRRACRAQAQTKSLRKWANYHWGLARCSRRWILDRRWESCPWSLSFRHPLSSSQFRAPRSLSIRSRTKYILLCLPHWFPYLFRCKGWASRCQVCPLFHKTAETSRRTNLMNTWYIHWMILHMWHYLPVYNSYSKFKTAWFVCVSFSSVLLSASD